MADVQFVKGMIAKAPRSGAPDFVKLSLSIKRDEFLDWMADQDGDWINIDVKESKNGKWYCAVDSWRPNSEKSGQSDRPQRQERQAPAREPSFSDGPAPGFGDDEIPF